MAFPILDHQYALIIDAATSTSETPGGLRAILTQVDKEGNFYAISFASRQLKDHGKISHPFFWKLPKLFEAWTYSMNNLEASN